MVPGPQPFMFNPEGAAWTFDILSGDLNTPAGARVFEEPACAGVAHVYVTGFNMPMGFDGEFLMLPPGAAWQPAGSVAVQSQEYAGVCTEWVTPSLQPTAPFAALISAGDPPTRTWTGGLYRVEGSP